MGRLLIASIMALMSVPAVAGRILIDPNACSIFDKTCSNGPKPSGSTTAPAPQPRDSQIRRTDPYTGPESGISLPSGDRGRGHNGITGTNAR